jgi:sugar-specific transcriptional regulator TrmB
LSKQKKKILDTLSELGFTKVEAKVYILIIKMGAIRAKDITKSLQISKQRLYPILKNLQSKGIVNKSLERPARFSAISFEKMLDLFVKAKLEEAKRLKKSQNEILSDWLSIFITERVSTPAQFTVIEGRRYIYSKIQQMILETKNKLSFVTSIPSLARADIFGLLDVAFHHPLRSKILFRYITEFDNQNVNAIKALLKKKPKKGFNLEGRTPDLGLKLCPRMFIKDEEETLFFIDQIKDVSVVEQDDVCLWTNCTSLVHGFLAMFEDLWNNSIDLEKKIEEIESGEPRPKTCVISDAKIGHTHYCEKIEQANEEIIMMTSSDGLINFCKDNQLLNRCAEKGVPFRIMAPITSENLKATELLSKFSKVRHVATCYLGTTIIDGKHLYQFKTPSIDKEEDVAKCFEDTFYTNDNEYIKKAKNMLEDIWVKAHKPSNLSIESIIKSNTSTPKNGKSFKKIARTYKEILGKVEKHQFYTDLEASKKITEKEVQRKAVTTEKVYAKDLFKEYSRMFTTTGWALIHPPKWFNLPKMLIMAMHIEKQSSLGEEDTIHVHLWLKTPKGYRYVPVAVVHDQPNNIAVWKKSMTGTPAENNVQTFEKDEIQVRAHGNMLFSGWTKPIALWPAPYSLPPSCLLFEGYGETRPGRGTMIGPSGVTNKMVYNLISAFVTLIHPESKYEGSGTEGIITRDCVIEVYPP